MFLLKGDVLMKKFTYIVKNKVGIHARPAGLLVDQAKKYVSEINLNCAGKKGNAKKIFSLMLMDVKCGDQVEVTICGEDEDLAAEQLLVFFQENL